MFLNGMNVAGFALHHCIQEFGRVVSGHVRPFATGVLRAPQFVAQERAPSGSPAHAVALAQNHKNRTPCDPVKNAATKQSGRIGDASGGCLTSSSQ